MTIHIELIWKIESLEKQEKQVAQQHCYPVIWHFIPLTFLHQEPHITNTAVSTTIRETTPYPFMNDELSQNLPWTYLAEQPSLHTGAMDEWESSISSICTVSLSLPPTIFMKMKSFPVVEKAYVWYPRDGTVAAV
jgi:hypothetical protein